MISLLRDSSVGTDYSHYITHFNNLTEGTYFFQDFKLQNLFELDSRYVSKEDTEILWSLLTYTVWVNGGTYYTINLLSIALILISLYIVAKKGSKIPLLTVVLYFHLYFYFATFNTIRQSIAVIIILLAITYATNKSIIKFIILVFVASLFHRTALIIIPLVLLLKFKINKNVLIILLILSFIFPFLNINIFRILIAKYSTGYQFYFGYFENINTDLFGLTIFYMINFINTIFLIYWIKKTKGVLDLTLMLWIFGVMILNALIQYMHIIRITEFFLISQIIAIPTLIYNSVESEKRKLTYIAITYSSLIFLINLVILNTQGIKPYLLR